jgi:hypothetical protein
MQVRKCGSLTTARREYNARQLVGAIDLNRHGRSVNGRYLR